MTTPLLTVWDDRYTSPAAPLTSTTKQRRVVELAQQEDLVRLVPPGPFDADRVWADIAQTHASAYVEAVRTGVPREWAESQWFTWSPSFADSVARIWDGHHRAVTLALDERTLVAHPVSGAHHAQRAKGAGFCTFNYLVADRGVGRTCILDLDAHYGDGSEAMTINDPQFVHFDIHRGTTWERRETKRGIWFKVRNADEYFAALDELPTFLDVYVPDLMQWQAGMDPYEHDEVGGIRGMGATQLLGRDMAVARYLLSRRIPAVVTLAGGYSEGVARLHVQTFRAIQLER